MSVCDEVEMNFICEKIIKTSSEFDMTEDIFAIRFNIRQFFFKSSIVLGICYDVRRNIFNQIQSFQSKKWSYKFVVTEDAVSSHQRVVLHALPAHLKPVGRREVDRLGLKN